GTNDIGNYFVTVSNGAGTVHSRVAVVGILPSNQLSLGLISYYKFDDGDGLVATNAVPGGQNLQVLGGNTFPDWPPGQVGTALTLEPGDYGFVPNYPKAATITVAGWVNSDNDTWGPIINNWLNGQVKGSSGQFTIDVFPFQLPD